MAEHTVVRNPNSPVRAETTRSGALITPRVDIFETQSELLLFADLPGVSPQDIDLRYERGELMLRGRVAREKQQGQAVLEEYETGDFYRVFQIHETIDASKI